MILVVGSIAAAGVKSGRPAIQGLGCLAGLPFTVAHAFGDIDFGSHAEGCCGRFDIGSQFVNSLALAGLGVDKK